MSTVADSANQDVAAIKRQISQTLRLRLKERGVTLASLARDTGTSRTAIRRVLDGRNTSITLNTLVRTAQSVGYRIHLTMEPTIDLIETVEAPPEVEPTMAELGRALDQLPGR